MKRLLSALLAFVLAALPIAGTALAQSEPEFRLGFKALADQIPDLVGRPLENERWGANGDSLQQTTGGLMVWRKAGNWTAFTDGHTTWVNGPNGLESRPNAELLLWELVGAYGASLPSASGGGRLVTLNLSADGTCTLTTEFLGRPGPIVEQGSWSSDGGSVAVVLTEIDGREIRTEITFEPRGDELVSTQWDQRLYGSAGLRLARQPMPAGLTLEQLLNAEYQVDFAPGRKARLIDGSYRQSIAPGSATQVAVRLGDQHAMGDLDGDGVADAAAVLIGDPGGSGTFYHLVALLNQGGQPRHVASALLGDRIAVNSLSIQSGEIVVSMLGREPGQPMSAPPSVPTTRVYWLEGGELKLAAEIQGPPSS